LTFGFTKIGENLGSTARPLLRARNASLPASQLAAAFAMALRLLAAAATAATGAAAFASWESHGELMDQEALKQKATSQEYPAMAMAMA